MVGEVRTRDKLGSERRQLAKRKRNKPFSLFIEPIVGFAPELGLTVPIREGISRISVHVDAFSEERSLRATAVPSPEEENTPVWLS